MWLFKKSSAGFMNEIRCDEPSYLIWKWHPAGSEAGSTSRENAIRWGSSLRVKDGEVAVFVYRQENGTVQDYILGPFDQILKTNNLPVLAGIIGLAYDGGTPFQAEVYFINLAQIIQVRFGIPFFDVYDPRFTDFGVPVAVRGTISFKISDYREFIKIHRLTTFSITELQAQIKDVVTRYIKDTVINAPAVHNIPIVQIESKTAQINDIVEYDISQRLNEDFGVSVSGIDIGAIEIDKSSEGYRQLMAVTRDVASATVKAQTAANIKNIEDKQRIEAKNYEETLRIQREEGQYAQHKSTQTSNFAAYQAEVQRDIGVAGAEALGRMGSSGSGAVNLGGEGIGFNPAAMMAGMAIGGAVGQNISGIMNGVVSHGANTGMTPPPVPTSSYYVASSGKPTGPFEINVLRQMITTGQFTADSLVWKRGMSQWLKASEVDELIPLLANTMPPIPPINS